MLVSQNLSPLELRSVEVKIIQIVVDKSEQHGLEESCISLQKSDKL